MGKTVCCWCTTADLRYKGNKCPEGTERDGSRCRCAVTLDQAEEGTYIDRRTGCPLLPSHLDRVGEIDAALSTTNFSLAFGALPKCYRRQFPGRAWGHITGFGVSTNQNNDTNATQIRYSRQGTPGSPLIRAFGWSGCRRCALRAA